MKYLGEMMMKSPIGNCAEQIGHERFITEYRPVYDGGDRHMPLKNPDLHIVQTTISTDLYNWMIEQIKDGRFMTKSEVLRQALWEFRHRKDTTISSFRE